MDRRTWVESLLRERGRMTAASVGAAMRTAGVVSPEECAADARSMAAWRRNRPISDWSSAHLVSYGATHTAAVMLYDLVRAGRAVRCGYDEYGKLLTGPVEPPHDQGA